MTTIALDKNGLVAYESRVTEINVIVDDNSDKHIKRKGVHYFFCGRDADDEALISAMEDGPADDYSDAIEVFALIHKDGAFFTAGIDKIEGFILQKERKGCSVALGSGQKHALTAMDMGMNAKEAVRMAIKRDCYSGGKIRTMQF